MGVKISVKKSSQINYM